MTINIDNIGPKLMLGFGGFMTIMGAIDIYKSKKLLSKIGMTIDDISNKTEIEVEKSFIDNTVKDLVEKKYEETVEEITEQVTKSKLKDIDTQIHDAVKKAVDDEVQDLTPMVESKLKKQLKAIDIDDVKADVLSEIRDESRRYLHNKINGITSRNFMTLL